MTYCIVNGHVVSAEEARISVQDRGFRYGDGVFETIAIHNGVPYQFDWHISRMEDGLRAIKITFDISAIYGYCRQLINKNAAKNGLLRIQVTRGPGSKGYLPDSSHPQAGATFVIETLPQPVIPSKPVSLWHSSYTKISARSLPVHYKLCQGLNSTLARMEAVENDCADALLLNEQGEICETSSGNIFWFKNGNLYTPAIRCGVLQGSTRAAIMRLSPYKIEKAKAGIDELTGAEAVFITNVVWPVIEVACLLPQEIGWKHTEIVEQIRRLINEDRESYSQAHRSKWQE